jgi:hypothetical protein
MTELPKHSKDTYRRMFEALMDRGPFRASKADGDWDMAELVRMNERFVNRMNEVLAKEGKKR